MKRLVPLLLAAAFSHVQAAPDSGACKLRYLAVTPGAVQDASARLAAARREPGEQKLVLAAALADLAVLSARQNGSPDIAADGNPAPAELLRQALVIWNAAPASATLAGTLHARGLAYFNNQHCQFGREVLESALHMSSAVAGPNDAASVAIAQDLLRVGLAQRDDALVRRLTPTAKAALEARTQPLDPQDEQTVLALVDFFYGQSGDNREDLQLAEHLAQRGLALSTPGAASPAQRLLSYRLASVYYAQLRYADGEALRSRLDTQQSNAFARKTAFMRQHDELVALVRNGDLKAALSMARAMLEQDKQSFEASSQGLAQAESAEAQARAQPDPTLSRAAIMLAVRDSAQARARRNGAGASLAITRSYVGEILQAMGDLDGAASAYETALTGFTEGAVTQWRDRTRTRSDLAILYRTRGDLARALTLQQQVLDELLPVVGEDHPDVKEARAELALLRKLQKG